MEEERKQKLYAEEVAAARRRRESQRAGVAIKSSASSSSLTGEPDFQPARDTKRYSRPVYDSIRRQASDPLVPYSGSEPPSPNTDSRLWLNSGSSQPGSRHNSRPSSLHSNYSTEDVLARGGGSGTKSKRSSRGSVPSSRPPSERASTWSSGHIPPVPMLPAMPIFPIDTPLLPPAPPFMMQQYPRPSRQTYNSASPSPGKISGLPNGHSSTQVNQQQLSSQRRPGSSSSSPGRQECQSNAPLLPLERQRRSSDDHKTSPSVTSHYSRSTSERTVTRSQARLPLPSSSSYLQLPTTSTYLNSSLSSGLGQQPPNRRQATIS